MNSTFPVALVEAVRQEDISVAGAPELSVESIGPDGYVFTALIDLILSARIVVAPPRCPSSHLQVKLTFYFMIMQVRLSFKHCQL